MMTLSLTYDHRVIDGADGARRVGDATGLPLGEIGGPFIAVADIAGDGRIQRVLEGDR